MLTKENKIFFWVTLTCYLISILLSAFKIYIYEAYPIFHSEEEFPGVTEQLQNALNFKFK